LLGVQAHLNVEMDLKSYLPQIDFPEKIGKYTPDIITKRNGTYFIVDVAVTLNPEFDRSTKIAKYSKIVDFLVEQGVPATLIIVAVKTNMDNLFTEIAQLNSIVQVNIEPYYDEFIVSENQAIAKVNAIRPYIPQEYFNSEFEIAPFRTEFLKPKEYTKLYKKSMLYKLENRPKITDQQSYEIVWSLFEDQEVYNYIGDKKHDVNEFQKAFDQLDELEPTTYFSPKPTFHFLYCEKYNLPLVNNIKNLSHMKQDQKYSLNILSYVNLLSSVDKKVSLCKHIFKQTIIALSDPKEVVIWNTGFYKGTHDLDEDLKKKFAEENNLDVNKSTFISIRKQVLPTEMKQQKPYIERAHQVCIEKPKDGAHDFLIKSGVKYQINHPDGRQYSEPKSCSKDQSIAFEHFMDLINKPSKKNLELDPLWSANVGKDSNVIMGVKQDFRNEFKNFHNRIKYLNSHHMSYHTSIAAEQAIHYITLNTKDNSFYFVNTGLPNVMHIFQGGTIDRSKDIGAPFFSIAITDNIQWASDVFGKHTSHNITIEGKKMFVIITSWRRLQIHKLVMLRDQFYSCQSTGFDTYQRNKRNKVDIPGEYEKFIYTFRTLVAQCTSQRVSEFLMDVRYIVMSCYADYTNVTALIKDKFAPHYPNSMTRWIIHQLKDKVFEISEAFKEADSFSKHTPIFVSNTRVQSSLGGKIKFPSLWTDYKLSNIQDLFDELFVYVHTGKDPSSNFAEGVKSLKTILKFQTEYDLLSDEHKLGIHTTESFKKYLLSGKQVGCWYDVILASVSQLSAEIPTEQLCANLDRFTSQEVLSDIESTKACIPEYMKINATESEKQPISEKKKKMLKKKRENISLFLKKKGFNILDEYKHKDEIFSNVHPQSIVDANSRTGRAKVHDLCLDFILRYPKQSQCVLDVAHWNLFENKMRVDADICIKSQYGAKREFYVINFGAKAMARMFENMYKCIAKVLPQEMISIPGDEKMQHMYNNINEVLRARHNPDDYIFYVNGDCTKWSACETMTSFWALTNGFSKVLGDSKTSFCKAVLSSWANKNILVPQDIAKGTTFITENTKYLQQGEKIKSTQNFLQGMFNYSSSVKAVAATEFAIRCWKYKYNNSRPIIIRHLEHSDDYSLIVRVNNVTDFEDFRRVHKLSQRLHGIVDSEKKTNCQRFIMEFISLMSFNGQMAYPNIKKTKEVGINIAGVGYQHDAMNIASRTSEALRLGVPQVSCYAIQMLQGINIYRKYSLGLRQRNECVSSIDPYNNPIELFGLPDCLPVLYLNTVGDPNNYRLYTYCPELRDIFKGLYIQTIDHKNELGDPLLSDLMPTFFTAIYSYKKHGNKLKRICKKIGWTQDKLNEYRLANPDYCIMKPRETTRFLDWLKAMYYNNSFSIAYTQSSRKMIMLRLSYFASGKCIRNPFSNTPELVTIAKFSDLYRYQLLSLSGRFQDIENKNLERMLLNTDPTLKAYFDLLSVCGLVKTGNNPAYPIITRFPQTYKFINLENNLSTVLQYKCNKVNFDADRRNSRGELSLERDTKKLIDIFGSELTTSNSLLQINKIMKSQSMGGTTGLCFSTTAGHTPGDTLEAYLENGMFYDTQYQFLTSQEFTVVDPITNAVIYTRDFLYTNNAHSIMLENLTQLMYFLTCKYQYEPEAIINIIKEIKFLRDGTNVIDELKKCTYDLNDITDTYHKRMYVFFFALLTKDVAPLHKFISNQYSIRHDYLTQVELSHFQNKGIKAVDGVAYTFRNVIFIAFKDLNENILLMCDQCTYTQAVLSYFAALRLFNLITQNMFEEILNFKLDTMTPTLKKSVFDSFVTETSRYRKFRLTFYHKTKAGIQHNTDPENALPIVMGIPELYKKERKILPLNLDVDIDPYNLCVKNGKITLFNLPLTPCGSSTVITYPNKIVGGQLNLKIFNTPKLMYNYLHDKQMALAIDENLIEDLTNHVGGVFHEREWGFPGIKVNDENRELFEASDIVKPITTIAPLKFEMKPIKLLLEGETEFRGGKIIKDTSPRSNENITTNINIDSTTAPKIPLEMSQFSDVEVKQQTLIPAKKVLYNNYLQRSHLVFECTSDEYGNTIAEFVNQTEQHLYDDDNLFEIESEDWLNICDSQKINFVIDKKPFNQNSSKEKYGVKPNYTICKMIPIDSLLTSTLNFVIKYDEHGDYLLGDTTSNQCLPNEELMENYQNLKNMKLMIPENQVIIEKPKSIIEQENLLQLTHTLKHASNVKPEDISESLYFTLIEEFDIKYIIVRNHEYLGSSEINFEIFNHNFFHTEIDWIFIPLKESTLTQVEFENSVLMETHTKLIEFPQIISGSNLRYNYGKYLDNSNNKYMIVRNDLPLNDTALNLQRKFVVEEIEYIWVPHTIAGALSFQKLNKDNIINYKPNNYILVEDFEYGIKIVNTLTDDCYEILLKDALDNHVLWGSNLFEYPPTILVTQCMFFSQYVQVPSKILPNILDMDHTYNAQSLFIENDGKDNKVILIKNFDGDVGFYEIDQTELIFVSRIFIENSFMNKFTEIFNINNFMSHTYTKLDMGDYHILLNDMESKNYIRDYVFNTKVFILKQEEYKEQIIIEKDEIFDVIEEDTNVEVEKTRLSTFKPDYNLDEDETESISEDQDTYYDLFDEPFEKDLNKYTNKIILMQNREIKNVSYSFKIIENLPDFPVYLMRSWSGNDALNWIRNAKNVFNLCKLYYDCKLDNFKDVDAKTKLYIHYLYEEIRIAKENDELVGGTFSIDDKHAIEFDMKKFKPLKEKKHFSETKAKLEAEHLGGIVIERDRRFVVVFGGNDPITEEHLKIPTDFNLGRHEMFREIAELGLERDLFYA